MRKTIYLLSFCLALFCAFSLNAQWIKTNGLPGGRTNSLINYGDTVLATVTKDGYVYKYNELYYSTNHGKTWSPIVHPSYGGITPLSIDGQTIIGYAYDRSTKTGFNFRSDDFFQTLHPISSDTLNLNWFFPAHGYIYAKRSQSPNSGLYRTNNDGVNWNLVSSQYVGYQQFRNHRMTGVKSNLVVQSTDEGFTWDTLLQYTGYANRLLQSENHLFLLTFSSASNVAACYTSNDQGQTWQYFPNDALDNIYDFVWHNGSLYGLDGYRAIGSSDFGQTWQDVALPQGAAYPAYYGVSSGNALIIGSGQSMDSPGMHRSTDNGNTWNPVSFGITSSSGKLRKYSQEMFVPSPGGLYKAEADGVNWAKIDLDIPQPPNQYWTVSDFVKAGNNWVLSDGQNLWVSQNQSNIWSKSLAPPGQSNLPVDVMYLENVQNKVIAHGPWQGYDAYYYFISDDNGLSFHFIETLFEQKQTRIGLLEVVGDKVYALGTDRKIYRSDDACATWVLQSDNLQTSGCGLPFWDVLSSSLQISGNVMVLNADYDTKIQFSNDAGQSWTCYDLETSGAPWGNSIINDLLYAGHILFAATQNGIYFSENDGTDWTD